MVNEYTIQGRPAAVHLLEINAPVENLPSPAKNTDNLYTDHLVSGSGYHKRIGFTYDTQGNLLEQSKVNDIPTTYLWGYNRSYPIAEIKNATYAEVVAVLGQSVIEGLAGASPGTDAEVRQKLTPLRTDSRLQKAQVTIYTYQPLVGMTSATDATGVTTYYEYDELQRLKRVKDREGNIVKHNIYHYKGQP